MPTQAIEASGERDFLDTVRLAMLPGVGPHLRRALLEKFGTPRAVFDAAPSEIRDTPGIGRVLGERIALARSQIDAAAEVALARQHGLGLMTPDDPAFPRLLREIHDPPGLLYVRGQLGPTDGLAIAIVGSRHATRYGAAQAERLAAGLTRAGLTIVSGLARGIDAAAHRGALASGGRSLAVLAGGVLNVYPPEHAALAEQIAGQGALLSEAPLQRRPLAGTFPQRNRLISGLSLGVLVVEAAERSGALITARHAMEQGRDVFAVPGRIDSRMSRGCHRLIQDGARLVTSLDDVLDQLGPLVEPAERDDGSVVRHAAELVLNPLEQTVLQAIDVEPTSIDEVVRATGLAVHRVLSTISVLEMRRLIRRAGGQHVMRV